MTKSGTSHICHQAHVDGRIQSPIPAAEMSLRLITIWVTQVSRNGGAYRAGNNDQAVAMIEA